MNCSSFVRKQQDHSRIICTLGLKTEVKSVVGVWYMIAGPYYYDPGSNTT